jgi:uncharacterized protein (DUF1015 family)
VEVALSDVRPFRAVRPRNELAGAVIAPPYDVLTEAEARDLARDRRCFVRITRSEVDLPEGSDPHGAEAYQVARRNLDAFLAEGLLVEDEEERFLFYSQQMGDHLQTGVLALASVAEYDDGRIARHEFTRPDKEDDRTVHMDVLDAQVGLVFLAYRPTPELAELTRQALDLPAAWSVQTEDGVVHTLRVAPTDWNPRLSAAFGQVPRLYIADGHHRSAAASRLHRQRQQAATSTFLAGFYPADQLRVMAYNRVVRDLNGHQGAAFLRALEGAGFEVQPTEDPVPTARGTFTLRLGGEAAGWYLLRARPEIVPDDPVAGLDVSVLQDRVLGPLLGIDDPRRSKRIEFVGGIRGVPALEAAVEGGAAAAFHLVPTSMDQLFAVADRGEVMPPKSTWFEPKLREGVSLRRLS